MSRPTEKLDHPNIIKCYDSWIEHGEFYVSLELCEHGDLETLVQSHQRAGTRVHPTQVCAPNENTQRSKVLLMFQLDLPVMSRAWLFLCLCMCMLCFRFFIHCLLGGILAR